MMQFLDWDFSQDLSTAVHMPGGECIRFTRAERSLLQALMSYKGRIWTRDNLLDAVAGIGSDSSDRRIDFTINRLRRKLGDSARDPRYIETRYGEGYVWIAESPRIRPAQHAALPAIRTWVRGCDVMSYCDRPDAERSIIHRHDDFLLVLRLQGFLFFGAANRLYDEVEHEVASKLHHLIIDFRDVHWVDETAMPALVRLERLTRDHGVELVFSSVRPVLDKALRSLKPRRFGTLDAALEWREARILEETPPAPPAERTLASCLSERLECAEAETVVRYMEKLVAPPGTTFVISGTTTREMFFLERGTAEVILDVDGTWVRASRIWPGTQFGEVGFHYGYPRTATVRALDECRAVRMDPPAVDRLESDHPRLALALHRFLALCAAKRLVFHNHMVLDFFRSTLR